MSATFAGCEEEGEREGVFRYFESKYLSAIDTEVDRRVGGNE